MVERSRKWRDGEKGKLEGETEMERERKRQKEHEAKSSMKIGTHVQID
jgi:hypothetical protein